MKIRPVEAELFHADGHDEAYRHFSQFYKRAQKHIGNVVPFHVTEVARGTVHIHTSLNLAIDDSK